MSEMLEKNILKLMRNVAKTTEITKEQLEAVGLSEDQFETFMQDKRMYLICMNSEKNTFDKLCEKLEETGIDWKSRNFKLSQGVCAYKEGGFSYDFYVEMTREEYNRLCGRDTEKEEYLFQ